MKWVHDGTWIVGGFALALTLIGTVSITSYQNSAQLIESADQIEQTSEILAILTDISAELAEVELRHWRYILLEDTTELERYQQAVDNLQSILSSLRSPLADTPIQQQRLATLEAMVAARLMLFDQSIRLYRGNQGEITPTAPLIAQNQENLNQILQVVAELETKEEDLLRQQLEQTQANRRFRMVIEVVGSLSTFAVLLGVFILLYRQMLKRQSAEAVQRSLIQEKELSELKLQFFSMVSHEFRTPLSLILGSAQLLGESLKHPIESSHLKNLQRIQTSAKMMTQLLSDILTLARADAGKLEFSPEWVEMQTFCLNLVEDFQLLNASTRSLEFSQHGTCAHAYVDEKLLYRILSNLLSNAIKYSPPTSPIYFTLICNLDAVIFQVQDHGIGISPDIQSALYTPFSRGQNVKAIAGSGLGLAVVKKCLDAHQGELSVKSQVDIGTTFTVKIPQPHNVRRS